MQLFRGFNRLMGGARGAPGGRLMRNTETGRETRRLLARLKRLEETEASEEARDEAQKILLARHLERLRGKGAGRP